MLRQSMKKRKKKSRPEHVRTETSETPTALANRGSEMSTAPSLSREQIARQAEEAESAPIKDVLTSSVPSTPPAFCAPSDTALHCTRDDKSQLDYPHGQKSTLAIPAEMPHDFPDDALSTADTLHQSQCP